MDPATRWFEVKDMTVQSSRSVMIFLDDLWPSRSPRPEFVGYDNGNWYKRGRKEKISNY
jgi:hypothetical protein